MVFKRIFALFSFALTTSMSVNAQANNDLAQVEQLQGSWETQGYGYIFQVSGTGVEIYETTDVSCLKSGLESGALSYSEKDNRLYFPVSIAGFINANMEVLGLPQADKKLFHRSDTNSFITAIRLAALPNKCQQPADSSAETSMQVFIENFNQHYPFFQQKNVSWQTPTGLGEDDKAALFNSMVELVSPLNDPHIALVAPEIDGYYFGNEHTSNDEHQQSAELQAYLEQIAQGPILSFANNQLTFARLNEGIGYLMLNSFSQYSEQGNFEDELIVLEQAIQTMFSSEPKLTGLILDLRGNRGGSDKLALAMASVFTSKPYFAYSKQARLNDKGKTAWTAPHQTMVRPHPSLHFDGPMVMLTDNDTVSAGETFIMAMMQRQPQVIRLGQRTKGSFSDMLPRTLPNGWLFALPNERYLDIDIQSYDISGIPPHIELETTVQPKAIIKAALAQFNAIE